MSHPGNGNGNGSLRTAREMAERLEVTPATVQRWTRDRCIPFYKTPGGQYRYDPEAVEQALKVSAAQKGRK